MLILNKPNGEVGNGTQINKVLAVRTHKILKRTWIFNLVQLCGAVTQSSLITLSVSLFMNNWSAFGKNETTQLRIRFLGLISTLRVRTPRKTVRSWYVFRLGRQFVPFASCLLLVVKQPIIFSDQKEWSHVSNIPNEKPVVFQTSWVITFRTSPKGLPSQIYE